MNTTTSAAKQDGREAALRAGKYAGHVGAPPCPHRDGTRDSYEWWEGFGEITFVQVRLTGDLV